MPSGRARGSRFESRRLPERAITSSVRLPRSGRRRSFRVVRRSRSRPRGRAIKERLFSGALIPFLPFSHIGSDIGCPSFETIATAVSRNRWKFEDGAFSA